MLSLLTTIPQGLFDNNTKVTDFSQCFRNCTNLDNIPHGLFDNNTLVTKFVSTFYTCRKITSIPQGLFDNNTKVISFYECFMQCSGLTSIPQGLFDNNTLATDFGSCFKFCSFQTIPAGLFDKNINATAFSYCFQACRNLQLNPFIFSLTQDKENRFANKTVGFVNCFDLTGTTYNGIQGTAPDLWNYTYTKAHSSGAFKNHKSTSLTNFADIPTAWK